MELNMLKPEAGFFLMWTKYLNQKVAADDILSIHLCLLIRHK